MLHFRQLKQECLMTAETSQVVAACGKFQPFHNDHLKYVLAAIDYGDHVIVGITNPDPWYIRPEEADLTRGTPASNPATYYERYLMVQGSLQASGVPSNRYDIVPFPINVPESWFYYIPRDATFLLTLYEDDKWLEMRRRKLEKHGAHTHVLWSLKEKAVSGFEIRQRIIAGGDWRALVPSATADVISRFGIDRRIRELAASPGTEFYRP